MDDLLDLLGRVITGFFDAAPAKSRWRRWIERALVAIAVALVVFIIYSK